MALLPVGEQMLLSCLFAFVIMYEEVRTSKKGVFDIYKDLYLVTRYHPFGKIDQLITETEKEACEQGGADYTILVGILEKIGWKGTTHSITKIGPDGIYDCVEGNHVKISGDLEYNADDTLYIVSAPDSNKRRPGKVGVIKDKCLLPEILAAVKETCSIKKLTINEVSYRGVYSVDEDGKNRKHVRTGLIGEYVSSKDRIQANT